MAIQTINNTDTNPDSLKIAADKINDNFVEVYSTIDTISGYNLPTVISSLVSLSGVVDTKMNTVTAQTALDSKVQLLPFTHVATIASGATAYVGIACTIAGTTGSQRFFFRVAGTLKNLTCWAGISSSLAVTFTVMRGVGTGASAATTLTKVITPAVNATYQSGSDTVNTVSIAAGDWIEMRIANSASSFGAIGVGGSIEFLPS